MKQTARKHKSEVLCTGKNKQMCLVSLLTRKPKQISKQEGSLTGPPPLCAICLCRERSSILVCGGVEHATANCCNREPYMSLAIPNSLRGDIAHIYREHPSTPHSARAAAARRRRSVLRPDCGHIRARRAAPSPRGPWPQRGRCRWRAAPLRALVGSRPGPRVRRRPGRAVHSSVCAFPRAIRPGERCAR